LNVLRKQLLNTKCRVLSKVSSRLAAINVDQNGGNVVQVAGATAADSFPPNVYDRVTIMVISLKSFNRIVNSLTESPGTLLDLIKSYHATLEEACNGMGEYGNGSRKVHIVERLCDTW
jgi:hypothetical protein